MAEKTTAASKAPSAPARYIVLADGITGTDGVVHFKWAELDADQIGDAARIEQLLSKKAIKAK